MTKLPILAYRIRYKVEFFRVFQIRIFVPVLLKLFFLSSNFRVYQKSYQNFTIPQLSDIFQSYFKEKKTLTFTELCNISQQQNETFQEFVVRLLCLRQKVSNLATKEDCPYDVKFLKQRFLQALEPEQK